MRQAWPCFVILGLIGTGVACVLNYRIIASEGRNDRLNRHLPAARGRHRWASSCSASI